jgi:hypothetical protein
MHGGEGQIAYTRISIAENPDIEIHPIKITIVTPIKIRVVSLWR